MDVVKYIKINIAYLIRIKYVKELFITFLIISVYLIYKKIYNYILNQIFKETKSDKDKITNKEIIENSDKKLENDNKKELDKEIDKDIDKKDITFTNKIIKKFVITGGPCSGKTTALERIQVFLRERGFRVFIAPEAATIMFLNGASFDDLKLSERQFAMQQFVLRTQMTLEDGMYNYARVVNQDAVILCDRGIMDGSAYISPELWDKVLKDANLDTISVRDNRYDAVFHLVTCADGAPDFYTLANNEARSEGLQQAIEVDRKLEAAWSGHPHHVIIDNKNKKSFDRKIEELIGVISKYLGLPSLTRTSYKFKLIEAPDFTQIPNVQIFDVEKIMLDKSLLKDSGNTHDLKGVVLYSFIRKRSQGGFHSHGLTTVRMLESGEKVELKQVITARMYSMLTNYADKSRNVVTQRRYYFLWEQQSFHIYEYISPEQGLWTLQCQSEGSPKLPPFLKVDKSIPRNNDSFSSYFISLKDKSRSNSEIGI